MKVMKYLVIDYCLNFSFISNSKEELIESLGYELGEIELLKIQLEERHTTAKQTLSSLTQQETQFNQSLFDKYGNIQLNPQTGEYTQTK